MSCSGSETPTEEDSSVLSEETWSRVFRLLVEEGIESEVDLVPYGDAVPPCGPWDTQPTYALPAVCAVCVVCVSCASLIA